VAHPTSITGTTGKVVKGAIVDAQFYNGSTCYLEDETTTSSSGKYSLTGLEPGSYKLEVYYPGATQAPIFSGGASTLATATALSLALGSSTTANLAFPKYSGGELRLRR
jgi:hypothetical protein